MSFSFIFPGQGSQSVGMSSALADSFDIVKQTYEEASDALGYNLFALVAEGPVDQLNKTEFTQPAILTASVAMWRVWLQNTDKKPAVMAGHSLGEYSALVSAGVLSLSDAAPLVMARGQFMQNAVKAGEGAMAAILGLADEDVVALCSEAAQGDVLAAVNFNSPGQVVIAGSSAAVERAIPLAKEKGAKRALPLPVSVPSHCSLMKPAAEKLAERMDSITFNKPAISVIHNVDVQAHDQADDIKRCLTEQLFSPVRWVETVQSIASQGHQVLVECGPGKVLTGLNKRIDKTLTAHALFDPATLEKVITEFEE